MEDAMKKPIPSQKALPKEVGGVPCPPHPVCAPEHHPRERQATNHETVPAREYFVVQPGLHPFLTGQKKKTTRGFQVFDDLFFRCPDLSCEHIHRGLHLQNALSVLEVSLGRDSEASEYKGRERCGERGANFVGRPNE